MGSSSILFSFYILAWMLCVLPTEAYWFRQARSQSANTIKRLRSLNPDRFRTSHETQGWQPNDTLTTSTTSSQSYMFSLPTPKTTEPTLTSQEMIVSSIIPLYEVCNTPGSNTTTCSTVFETITTMSCSTVLTYAFTQATISHCNQNITFSTRNSFTLATATVSPITTPAVQNQQAAISSFPPSVTTYVQSIVSYYIASWQSLAANTPSNITVLICEYDYAGNETCLTIQEIWVVHTEYVPVTITSTLIISTALASPAVLLLSPTESITATAGPLYVSTQIEYSSMSLNATTSISTILATSTTISTLTLTSTLPAKTITITLSSVTPGPTTTYTSTTVMMATVAVKPLPLLRA